MEEVEKRQNNAKQVRKKVNQKGLEARVILESKVKSIDLVKRLFIAVFILLILLVFSISSNIVFYKMTPDDRYFVVDENLRVIQMTPTNQPMLSDSSIINFAKESLSTVNSISFANWKQVLQENSFRFSQTAHRDFISELQASGNLDLIINKRLNAIVNIDGAAIINRKGLSGSGSYLWRVEVPYIINYESSKGVEATQRLLGIVTISRVPTSEIPSGIKIVQFATTER